MRHLFKRYWKDTQLIFIIFALMLLIITFFMVYLFPTIKTLPKIQEILNSLPPFIKAMLGEEIVIITQFEGFMCLRYFNVTMVWVTLIFSIFLCANMISVDISSQRMDIILSQPVARYQIILSRYLVFLTYILGLLVVSCIGLYLGMWWIDQKGDWSLLMKMMFSILPLPLAVGSICLLISCRVDDPIKSTSICLGIFILLFLVNAALTVSQDFRFLKKLILFSYYDATKIFKFQVVNYGDIAILSAVAIFFLFASLIYFERKEIYV